MFIDLTEEQKAVRKDIEAYFDELMTPERRKSGSRWSSTEGAISYRDTIRQLGKDGWLGVGWPKEYGGKGWGPIEQLIFVEAAARYEVPLPQVTINTVGPIHLNAGQRYYIESYMREGGGADNFDLTWKTPGDASPCRSCSGSTDRRSEPRGRGTGSGPSLPQT